MEGKQDGCEVREAAIPHGLNKLEKNLDRLADTTHKLVERLEIVTHAQAESKGAEPPAASHGVPLAERIARINEGLENAVGRLQDVLDRLEI